MKGERVLLIANEAFFLLSHRRELLEELVSRGVDLHVATPPDHVWAPPGFSIEDLELLGLTHHPIQLSRRGQNPVVEMKTFRSIRALADRLRPRLLHNLTLKPIIYGGLAATALGVPSLVSSFTGLGQVFSSRHPAASLRRRLVIGFLRRVAQHPNASTIFQNEWDRDRMVDEGVVGPDRAVVIVGSGVDTAVFSPTPAPDTVPTVILPARLIWDKGIAEFVKVATSLHSRGIEAKFVLVGQTHPSNARAVPEAQLRQWQAEGHIEWWAYRDDMPSVYSGSNIVCQPTSYGEGVPKVLLEAAACGRPVVATNLPGCKTVVEHGETGYLVAPDDPDDLERCLADLLGNPELRHAMGVRARERAVREWDVRAVVSATTDVYERTLALDGHRYDG